MSRVLPHGKGARPDVLIIGGGSHGLLVLERLASAVKRYPARTVQVVVAEPEAIGPGVHHPGQGAHIVFNTATSCPTLFANDSIPGLAKGIAGPSFREWLGMAPDTALSDFQPRAKMGEYLQWSAKHIIRNLPSEIEFVHVAEPVTAACRTDEGLLKFLTALDRPIRPKACVLALGHGLPDREMASTSASHDVIQQPLAPGSRLRQVRDGHTVAIQGMGLTALDIIAELTVGRGGAFESGAAGTLRYEPSGREPRMLVYSRTSCPVRSRPSIRASQSVHEMRVLSADRLRSLANGHVSISFQEQVFPLILAEMACRLDPRAIVRDSPGLSGVLASWNDDKGWNESSEQIARRFADRSLLRSFMALLRPTNVGSREEVQRNASRFIAADLRESLVGTSGSSLKAALEVLLEARTFIKALSDYKGNFVIDRSWMNTVFRSIVNRNVIGPHESRNAEMLALLEGRVVQVVSGGSTVIRGSDGRLALTRPDGAVDEAIDFLIAADGSQMHVLGPLVESLFRIGAATGLAEGQQGVIGINVGQNLRVISQAESTQFPLWAIGPICEGSSYYNNYVPCIQPDAVFPFLEADRVAAAVLSVALTS